MPRRKVRIVSKCRGVELNFRGRDAPEEVLVRARRSRASGAAGPRTRSPSEATRELPRNAVGRKPDAGCDTSGCRLLSPTENEKHHATSQ